MIFCERLKELRLKSEMTQDELAKKINISTSTISFYESGAREPNLSTLISLAKIFNVSTDYLLGLTDISLSEDEMKVFIDEILKIMNELKHKTPKNTPKKDG